MIRALIVDDEPLARDGLRARLSAERGVVVVGEAGDGHAAVKLVRNLRPDLLFLDVQMPGMDGFAVLRALDPDVVPVVVLVTAFDRYAVQAFEAQALDYLLKPYNWARFAAVVRRARRELERSDMAQRHDRIRRLLEAPDMAAAPSGGKPEGAAGESRRLPVRDGERYLLLNHDEIDYVESAGNNVRVHARGTVYLMRATLRRMEDRLEGRQFVRIHRSAIVNVDRVAEIVPEWHGDFDVTLTTGVKLRMSRTHRKNLIP